MKKNSIIIGVACATLAVVAWAAEPAFHGRGPQSGGEEQGAGHEAMLMGLVSNPELAKKAGITEEQIGKLKDGQYEFQKNLISLRAEAEQAKLEVRHLMQADKADRAAIEKAIDVAGAKELALRKATILHMLDVKEAIGPAAAKKIKEMIQQHRGQMGGDHPILQQRIQQMRQFHGGGQGAPQQGEKPWMRNQMTPPEQPATPAPVPAPTT